MESKIFADEKVREAFRNYVVVSIYRDEPGLQEKFEELQKELTGSFTLPEYVILDPASGQVIRAWGFHLTTLNVPYYLNQLDKGKKAVDWLLKRAD